MATLKKRIVIYISVAIAALLIIAGIFTLNSSESIDTSAELLSLGEKYLSEFDYEQALVQFLKVIEIEPMNERAYLGAAEAYIGLGQIEDALAVLKRGLAMLPNSEAIKEMLAELSSNPSETAEAEAMDSQELSAEQIDILKNLMTVLIDEEYAIAAEIVSGDPYKYIVEFVNEKGPYFYNDSGMNLGVYRNGHIYVGALENGIREGAGVWFSGYSSVGDYRYYVGAFANDAPNGAGTIYQISDAEHGILNTTTGLRRALTKEYAGTFIDGYYDGVFSVTWHTEGEEPKHWSPTYVDGVPQRMEGGEMGEDGEYNIAFSDASGYLSDNDEPECIFDFSKE